MHPPDSLELRGPRETPGAATTGENRPSDPEWERVARTACPTVASFASLGFGSGRTPTRLPCRKRNGPPCGLHSMMGAPSLRRFGALDWTRRATSKSFAYVPVANFGRSDEVRKTAAVNATVAFGRNRGEGAGLLQSRPGLTSDSGSTRGCMMGRTARFRASTLPKGLAIIPLELWAEVSPVHHKVTSELSARPFGRRDSLAGTWNEVPCSASDVQRGSGRSPAGKRVPNGALEPVPRTLYAPKIRGPQRYKQPPPLEAVR